jgi:hypothetical protein
MIKKINIIQLKALLAEAKVSDKTLDRLSDIAFRFEDVPPGSKFVVETDDGIFEFFKSRSELNKYKKDLYKQIGEPYDDDIGGLGYIEDVVEPGTRFMVVDDERTHFDFKTEDEILEKLKEWEQEREQDPDTIIKEETVICGFKFELNNENTKQFNTNKDKISKILCGKTQQLIKKIILQYNGDDICDAAIDGDSIEINFSVDVKTADKICNAIGEAIPQLKPIFGGGKGWSRKPPKPLVFNGLSYKFTDYFAHIDIMI